MVFRIYKKTYVDQMVLKGVKFWVHFQMKCVHFPENAHIMQIGSIFTQNDGQNASWKESKTLGTQSLN